MDITTTQPCAEQGADPNAPPSPHPETNNGNAKDTYWGILCRSCQELVAFDRCPYPTFGAGAANQQPAAIRCSHGHNFIYFPRDFQFVTSALSIPDTVLLHNRETFRAINPSPTSLESGARRHESSRPDPARESAQAAAKLRWASWALKKST
jgi:hypothetical protein